MKARISSRSPCPQKNDIMRAAIQEEWDKIDFQDLENLIISMPVQAQALLSARGGHTRF